MVKSSSNRFLRSAYRHLKGLQPVIREFQMSVLRGDQPTHHDGGMTTRHQVPWLHDWQDFEAAMTSIREGDFDPETYGVDPSETFDRNMWRYWNVAYSIRHAVEHCQSVPFNAIECGVAEGGTAFIAATQLAAEPVQNYALHLYDAWEGMRGEGLLPSEISLVGRYSSLSESRARANLERFSTNLCWHPGYIPESLDDTAPTTVSWLHIDLNSATATLDVLEFLWPRMPEGSVLLFDDHGWLFWDDTRQTINQYLRSRPGTLLPLSTGQALYFR